ncbi:MAG: hypothetical protein OER86_00245 [Phycisphaerae bacterium]|nr:hypothetical protein [Phycisphaerae bacterium]
MIRSTTLVAVAVLLAALPAAADAQDKAQLLDLDLELQEIRFASLADEVLTFYDAERRRQSASIFGFLALSWTDRVTGSSEAEADADFPHRLLLADGHVIRGRFGGVDDKGRVIWTTRHFGTLPVKLDAISAFRKPVPAAPAAPPETKPTSPPDKVPPDEAPVKPKAEAQQAPPAPAQVKIHVHEHGRAAGNVAVAEGVVAEVRAGQVVIKGLGGRRVIQPPDAQQVALQPPPPPATEDDQPAPAERPLPRLALAGSEGSESDEVELANGDRLVGFVDVLQPGALVLDQDGRNLEIAWDRIAAVTLANPARRKPGDWVSLSDGSEIRFADAALDSEVLSGRVFGNKTLVELEAGLVRRIDFATDYEIRPLQRLRPTQSSGGLVFGVPMPPRHQGDALYLHAPLTLRYRLPAGVVRLRGLAAMDESAGDWGDLVLKIRDGQGELLTQRLNRRTPEVAVNLRPRDRDLVLELDDATNGPVRDRLWLREAFILVKRPR